VGRQAACAQGLQQPLPRPVARLALRVADLGNRREPGQGIARYLRILEGQLTTLLPPGAECPRGSLSLAAGKPAGQAAGDISRA
jgi:hypothetical protein